MSPSNGRTPVGQSNDKPNLPPLPNARIMYTTPSAYTYGTPANLGEATSRSVAY